jgi:hypothetical protein
MIKFQTPTKVHNATSLKTHNVGVSENLDRPLHNPKKKWSIYLYIKLFIIVVAWDTMLKRVYKCKKLDGLNRIEWVKCLLNLFDKMINLSIDCSCFSHSFCDCYVIFGLTWPELAGRFTSIICTLSLTTCTSTIWAIGSIKILSVKKTVIAPGISQKWVVARTTQKGHCWCHIWESVDKRE